MLATKERIVAQRQFATERYILSTIPVLYLPLYRLDGVSFISADGHGHKGTVTGALWSSQGRVFDGDDFITIPASATLQPITDGYTIIVGFKHTMSASPDFFFVYDDGATGVRMGADTAGTKLACTIRKGGAADAIIGTAAPINDGGFHQGTFVRDEGDGKIYLYQDGVSVAAAVAANTTSQSINPAGDAFIAGKLGGAGTELIGTIIEVFVYKRALSPAEVQQIYLTTKWRYQ